MCVFGISSERKESRQSGVFLFIIKCCLTSLVIKSSMFFVQDFWPLFLKYGYKSTQYPDVPFHQ